MAGCFHFRFWFSAFSWHGHWIRVGVGLVGSFRRYNFPLRVHIFRWQFVFFFLIHWGFFIIWCFSFIHQCGKIAGFVVFSVIIRSWFFNCGFRVAQDFCRTVIRYMAQGFTGTAFDGRTVFAGMTRLVAVCTY